MPTHFQGPKQSVRALNAFINLARASDSLMARLSLQLESEGLTTGQFGILEALLHLGPMCQKTLAEKLLRSGGNITLVVDNLEKHGWVRRERQDDDRRKILVHLTPEGRKLIGRIFPRHVEAIVEEMSRLEPAEQEALRNICRKLGRAEVEESNLKNSPLRSRRREKDHATNSTK
jgi:MarR family transcriptional regulator, 2-MHQ and catechol-resistance regulon repressor